MREAIVVGGGVAGTSAAASLAERGIRVLLLERSARLGGRAASFSFERRGEEVDTGEHVLLRCCTEVVALLAQLGVEESVAFQPRLRVPMRSGSRRTVLRSSPLPGPLHLLPGLLGYNLLHVRERWRAVGTAARLLLGGSSQEETFRDWLERRGESRAAIERLWDPISVATLNAHANTARLDLAAKVFRDAFSRPHGADLGFFTRPLSRVFSAIVPYLAARGGAVRLGARVDAILANGGAVRGVRLAAGEVLESDAVVAAVPPFDLGRLLPREAVGDVYLAGLGRLRWAPIVNVHLWFDRPVLDEPFTVCVGSPLQAVFDVSRLHNQTDATHLVLSQSAAEEWLSLSPAEIEAALLPELRRAFPEGEGAKRLDALVVKHPRATWVPGPGSERDRLSPLTPIRGLVLAGDATTTGWPSTLEGAVRSGRTAAGLLL